MKNIDKLICILRKMGNKSEKVIGQIELKNPELARLIRDRMFMFEDIRGLRKVEIEQIVRNVPVNTLVLSLKGTDEDFRSVIYGAVTKRVAETMREDLEILGPVNRADVEVARGEVMDAVTKLMNEGKINKDRDEIYV